MKENITESYNHLINLIKSVLLLSGAKVVITTIARKPPTPWWDEDCTFMYKQKRVKYRNFLHSPCPVNL